MKSKLSGGDAPNRVALCRLLLEKPDILRNSTNHQPLDAESVAWLERFLHDRRRRRGGTRPLLRDNAGWILELDRGEGIRWEGNYSAGWNRRRKRVCRSGAP
ncbi:hypothetical protein KCP73_08390 [Salmonella enterica subsp. enterica]|nr:hypothetical protein KCP73_08390 [Salmonella enterica subsp. enterica]